MTAQPGISIVYVTHRTEPRFDWFADSLARQAGDDEVEVVLVDGLHSAERRDAFGAAVAGRFAFRHVPAKPTPYNGPSRLTPRDHFAAASARNTGIVHATKPYLVMIDDLSLPMPGWWDRVRAASREGYVVAGAYQKHRRVVVENGRLVASHCEPSDIDSRWPQGDDGRDVLIAGGQLFGCSFGAPRDALIEVNGCDELCDPCGLEDCHLGVRLEWSGLPIHYSRRMLTVECGDRHAVERLVRQARTVEREAYMAKLAEFGLRRRHVEGTCDSPHMVVDLLFGLMSTQTLGNYYLLSALDEAGMAQLPARFPARYWFDDSPLSEL